MSKQARLEAIEAWIRHAEERYPSIRPGSLPTPVKQDAPDAQNWAALVALTSPANWTTPADATQQEILRLRTMLQLLHDAAKEGQAGGVVRPFPVVES